MVHLCHPKTGLELPTQTMSQSGPIYTGATENVALARKSKKYFLNASKGHLASAQGMGARA